MALARHKHPSFQYFVLEEQINHLPKEPGESPGFLTTRAFPAQSSQKAYDPEGASAASHQQQSGPWSRASGGKQDPVPYFMS